MIRRGIGLLLLVLIVTAHLQAQPSRVDVVIDRFAQTDAIVQALNAAHFTVHLVAIDDPDQAQQWADRMQATIVIWEHGDQIAVEITPSRPLPYQILPSRIPIAPIDLSSFKLTTIEPRFVVQLMRYYRGETVDFRPVSQPAERLYQGNALFRSEQYDLALAQYEHPSVLAMLELSQVAWVNIGNLQQQKAEFFAAHIYYQRALDANSGYVPARFYQGVAFFNQGEIEQAIAAWEQVLEQDPNHSDAYTYRGVGLINLEQPEQAYADYTRAIAANPFNPQAYHYRANLYFNLPQMISYQAAMQDYDMAITLQPVYPSALSDRGNLRVRLGKSTEAIPDFDLAIAQLPRYAFAYFSRGGAYARLGDYTKAVADLEQVIAIDPNYPSAYWSLGHAQYQLGEYQASVQSYSEAIIRDISNSNLYYNRAFSYFALERYGEALSDLHNALRLNNFSGVASREDVLWFRGNVYFRLGLYEQAYADYQAATQEMSFNGRTLPLSLIWRMLEAARRNQHSAPD